ncbi:cysteine desulfurase family protein [Draconibacterium sediminis]|uniref:cysteine desulfurase family protein n=1 Tax=Draconibacterium sediminis TaxID=1544798 RepID=UPI000B1A8F6F|nr:aminotransferase class V-fold PLP-dependent enzyme [Draconibacterium sediminis]
MSVPIYLDYNATTPIAPEVTEEMLPYILTYFGNPSSSYAIGCHNKEAIEKARMRVAGLLGAKPEEIIFTSGGTESNNYAIRGAVLANQDKGKHIITSQVEHPVVTEVCSYLEKQGYEITQLPVDSYGKVNLEDVEKAIRPDTVLISIMHANNEVGTIQPVKEIGEIAKKHSVLFHTDAAQSVGKIETDVNKLGIDMLSVAGHKLYAPKGIGALYIRDGVRLENLIFGAVQEQGLRPGTENVPYIVALGKACELATDNFETSKMHLYQMRQRLLNGFIMKCQTTIKLNADLKNCLPNTLSIAFDKVDAHTLVSLVSQKVFSQQAQPVMPIRLRFLQY